jgi:cell division septation protein DedD
VSELSHDAADDGFHEIQLSGKQLVFLFIVTTTVIVVVFLCGVKVGRGVRAAQGDETDQPPLSAAATPSQPQPVAETGPPAAEPPAPAAETPEELSYHKRLQGTAAAPETLKPEEPKPAAAAPPAASAPATERPAAAATKQATAPPAPDTSVPTSGKSGTWVVQVIATRDRAVANSVVKKLAAKGYPAFLVTPGAGAAQPFYKVHVGRYDDRGEAEQVSTRIKKEEQFQSWITR